MEFWNNGLWSIEIKYVKGEVMGILRKKKTDLPEENMQDVEISFDNIDISEEELDESDVDTEEMGIELEPKDIETGSKDAIADACEQIAEARKQIEEGKLEYKAVTDYLADIQKIDRIPSKDRAELEDAARNIITLTRERSKYQATDMKLTDVQFRNISRYEPNMLREIKQMRENEDYQRKVKGDLRQLAAEKAKLEFEKDEIIRGQDILKRLAILAGCLIVLMDLIFLLVSSSKQVDLKIPFILSIIFGAGIAFYIFYESRKNREGILHNGRKRNKLVGLTNKVKVKYVNTQNALDYAYEKFMVSNSAELNSVYEKYISARQEADKYRSNTGMLNHYNMVLVKELEQYQLKDSDIWIYQAAALIDNREMVEIRHRLNDRRQKLRSRIDFNYEVQEDQKAQLKLMMEKNPELKGKIEEEMGKWSIELE